jgi:hypothetical protein
MIHYPYAHRDLVICACCGRYVENTPEHNVSLHGEDGSPYPCDDGYGECIPCGGDPHMGVPDDWPSEAQTRRKLGWGMSCFVDARIPLVRNALSKAENRAKFDAMTYAQKVNVVTHMVGKGVMC